MPEHLSQNEPYFEVYFKEPDPTEPLINSAEATIEAVAQEFSNFLGPTEFGPPDIKRDPFYWRSRVFAERIIPIINNLLQRAHFSNNIEDKINLIFEAEATVAQTLLEYSGQPDQYPGEDFTKDPLYKRSYDHDPEIIKILAVGGIGLAALRGVIALAKHRKQTF